MKKACLFAFICFTFMACKHTLSQQEQKLCGRWMTAGEKFNREWFDFKPDGTFTDERFKNPIIETLPKPITYAIVGNQLVLKYKSFIYLRYSVHYNIISITDSTLQIATKENKRYPSQIYHLKKMKLNGKFIRG